jgi:hypothetical protein
MVSIKNILSYLMALFIIKTAMALQNWESVEGTRWANNCDFEGNHIVNKTMLAEECGGFCQFTVADCTHFTFTTTTSDNVCASICHLHRHVFTVLQYPKVDIAKFVPQLHAFNRYSVLSCIRRIISVLHRKV